MKPKDTKLTKKEIEKIKKDRAEKIRNQERVEKC